MSHPASALLPRGVVGRRELPVGERPEASEVVGAGIAIVDVVGVLPHVACEEGDRVRFCAFSTDGKVSKRIAFVMPEIQVQRADNMRRTPRLPS